MEISLYTDPSAMEPMFPVIDEKLKTLATNLIGKSSALSASLHPTTAEAVARLIEPMNSYYSNLIEGHRTNPLDIEKALKGDYSAEPKKRELQLESLAHVRVQKLMKKKLREENISICSTDFLKWLHKEFYDKMPPEFRIAKTKEGKDIEIIPGAYRTGEVIVGKHIPPSADALQRFMTKFFETYNRGKLKDTLQRIIAIAASHHRLAWIHPFQDGNGRVVRLYSESLFIEEKLDGNNLWCISRGLAVYNERYFNTLHNADLERRGDYDGRGNLSGKYFYEFCEFFLETALDQVNFMTQLLDIDASLERISKYVDLMSVRKGWKPEAKYILHEAFLKGKVGRGDAIRLTGKKETSGRAIVKELMTEEFLIEKEGESRGALYINFPVKITPYIFPRLYPQDAEASLIME